VIAFLPGAYLLRAGKLMVAPYDMAACVLLAIAWVFGLGTLIGPGFAHWPKMLLAMLALATLLLAIQGVQHDRERVMGTGQDRDALTTAAFLYGASNTYASDAAGDIGDTGAGDA
jgi:hypothetical protein